MIGHKTTVRRVCDSLHPMEIEAIVLPDKPPSVLEGDVGVRRGAITTHQDEVRLHQRLRGEMKHLPDYRAQKGRDTAP